MRAIVFILRAHEHTNNQRQRIQFTVQPKHWPGWCGRMFANRIPLIACTTCKTNCCCFFSGADNLSDRNSRGRHIYICIHDSVSSGWQLLPMYICALFRSRSYAQCRSNHSWWTEWQNRNASILPLYFKWFTAMINDFTHQFDSAECADLIYRWRS